MALVHLQTTQISKYIFFENSSTIHNEFIVFQRFLQISKANLKEFIKSIIPDTQYEHKNFQKQENNGDFHGDTLSCDNCDTQINLKEDFRNIIVKEFTIGSNIYTFHGVGIDIHTGNTFTRIKNGQKVTKFTPRNSYGNVDPGNIELKYRCPDLNCPDDPKKGRMIILNFHIELDDKYYDIDRSKNNFTTQLKQMYGNEEISFIKQHEEYLKQLEGMNISNFQFISNEPMIRHFQSRQQTQTFKVARESQDIYEILVSYEELRHSKENLETKTTEMLEFFKENIKKTNNTPLTFQCVDEAITEEQVIEKFPDCRIQ